MNGKEWVKIEDWVDRLMCVHEGLCPDCGHDLYRWRLGGTMEWLLDMAAGMNVVHDDTLKSAAKLLVDGRTSCKAYATLWSKLLPARLPNGKVVFWYLADQGDPWRHIDAWNPSEDGYGDVGLMAYRCPNVPFHRGTAEFETYQGCGYDWTLAEHVWPLGSKSAWATR